MFVMEYDGSTDIIEDSDSLLIAGILTIRELEFRSFSVVIVKFETAL